MTYEQAVEKYEITLEQDNIVNAYARLFSDYIGLMLGILPAFFAITRVLKDKKNKVLQVTYSKPISTTNLVISKYLGMVIMTFIPVLLISCLALAHSVYVSHALDVEPNYFGFLTHTVGWLLPTILFTIAISYFVAEWSESLLSILISIVIWFMALVSTGLKGVGYSFIPRFNALGDYLDFQRMLPQLVVNRIMYSLVSVAVLVLVILVVDKKRRGGTTLYGKISKHSKSK